MKTGEVVTADKFICYKVYFDSHKFSRVKSFTALSIEEAKSRARDIVFRWFTSCIQKSENESVEITYRYYVSQIQDVGESKLGAPTVETITLGIDHSYLIARVGGNSSCSHDWVSDAYIEGGNEDNPGVFELEKSMNRITKVHCSKCCLAKTNIICRGKLSHTMVRDTVYYGFIKYPINADDLKELTDLDSEYAFTDLVEEPNDAKWIAEITLDQLINECEDLLTNCWNHLGFNPKNTIEAVTMAYYLKNKYCGSYKNC